MKKFIYKHLNQEYEIITSVVGNDGIYSINTRTDIYRTPEYGNRILKNVSSIFNIDFEKTKEYICEWAIEKVPNVDLTFYWENNYNGGVFDDITFPLVRRVFAQTLGNDLVAVQPMSTPKIDLMYLDFVYKKKQNWYEKIWDKIKDLFTKKIKAKAKQKHYEIVDHDANKNRWMEQYNGVDIAQQNTIIGRDEI